MANNLDKELADAAGLDDPNPEQNSENGASDDGAMTVSEASAIDTADEKRRPPIALLAMLLLMAGGIVALFMFGFEGAAVYSMPLDKLLADRDNQIDRRVRIEGELVPGSLRKRDKPCEYRFEVRSDETKLEIRYPQCVVPDTFRDVPEGGVMVTAEGALASKGHFEATQIMAKCSSKYDPETHEMSEVAEGPTATRQ